ncbi:MAG TPA: class I mannose-6-phosphate isomerase [Bacteroidales bacterium]|nr:class I mannose-6-phosphate isomerase [Bacteroidales bacterium]
MKKDWRKTQQHLIPGKKPKFPGENYDIYPSFKLKDNQIFSGFESLAAEIKKHRIVIIDGYIGVFFDRFRKVLDIHLKKQGATTVWKTTSDYYKPPDHIKEMISPFLGEDDPLFGKRINLNLEDFFDTPRLKALSPDSEADITLIIGPGAALTDWKGLLVYIDLPKNELQFRSRAGSVTNLGATTSTDPKEMYKRFYFVDWIVLNKHKRSILKAVDLFVDGQRPESPFWMNGGLLRHSLTVMSHNLFRVRPWFEPGTWGGTWIMDHIGGLNKEVANYAWSFELIVPENGLLFESSGMMLEVSFDCLMFMEGEAVLGDCFPRFGTDFPIRFDFLDTFDGGNLSVQCHPRPDYMKNHFGENFTQEETYYIIDTKDNAIVYLGFQNNIDPSHFRKTLETSYQKSEPVDLEKFVQRHNASKHDLFLIPFGTIHGSGKNNLVLEISSTPYIFTFKMYDWLRPDLDGKPRPLNIQRGMNNLFFDRKGPWVKDNLISHPALIDKGEGWQLYHLPTHETHLYDVHRFHIKNSIDVRTENKFHVLNLVEGSSIIVETLNGISQEFNYAETFIIPASACSYRITNKSDNEAVVIKAFVK